MKWRVGVGIGLMLGWCGIGTGVGDVRGDSLLMRCGVVRYRC